MGFPVGYSDLLLPRLFLHFFLLLGTIRRFLLWAFRSVGLGDLLELDEPPVPVQTEIREFKSVPIDEALPVVKFRELDSRFGENREMECCAVCLYDIKEGEEVRELRNCTHVFHKGCIDRWIEHDQHTCPLCRAKLLPDEMTSCCTGFGIGIGIGINTGTGNEMDYDMGFYDYDYFFPSLPSVSSPSPVFFQAHQLIGGI